jgi:hypothetical protein
MHISVVKYYKLGLFKKVGNASSSRASKKRLRRSVVEEQLRPNIMVSGPTKNITRPNEKVGKTRPVHKNGNRPNL